MTEIYIDDKKIVFNDNISFKMTKENEYFSGASEYSGEIEVFMYPENIKILGNLSRFNVKKESKTYKAKVIVNNKIILSGTATILSISEESVKLQLLGNNSAVNFRTKLKDLYIDKLELGNAFDDITLSCSWTDRNFYSQEIKQVKTLKDFQKYIAITANFKGKDYQNIFFRRNLGQSWTLLPAMTENGDVVNARCVEIVQTDLSSVSYSELLGIWPNAWKVNYVYAGKNNTKIDSSRVDNFTVTTDGFIAPQPYLITILERVIKALDYEFVNEVITSEDWRKWIYIPNVTETIEYKDMLPHWTVNEFLTEIEKFFGIMILFDEETKVCKLLDKETYIKENIKKYNYLEKVTDIYNVEIDDDNMVDVSGSNVSYDIKDDLIHKFSDDIMNNAIIEEYEDIYELDDSLKNEYTKFGNPSKKVIADLKGRQYIVWGDVIKEIHQVNHLRDYKVNDSDNSVVLKIRPPKMDIEQVQGYVVNQNVNRVDNIVLDFHEKIPMPVVEFFGHWDDDYSIYEAIVGENDKIDKPDYIPVCMENLDNNPFYTSIVSTAYKIEARIEGKRHWGYTHGDDDLNNREFGGFGYNSPNLKLVKVEGESTLYNKAIDKGYKIHGQQAYQVTFFDETEFDFQRFFVIKGKLFIVAKIEYTITAKGIEKEKKGIFYPVEINL